MHSCWSRPCLHRGFNWLCSQPHQTAETWLFSSLWQGSQVYHSLWPHKHHHHCSCKYFLLRFVRLPLLNKFMWYWEIEICDCSRHHSQIKLFRLVCFRIRMMDPQRSRSGPQTRLMFMVNHLVSGHYVQIPGQTRLEVELALASTKQGKCPRSQH